MRARITIVMRIMASMIVFLLCVVNIRPQNIIAANGYSVEVPSDQLFLVDQEITADMFKLQFNNSDITDFNNVKIKPNTFSVPGTYKVGIEYFRGSDVYYEQIDIDVVELETIGIEVEENTVTLIQDQKVSASDIPQVYIRYNDGTRKVITDYKISVDWKKSICTVSYGDLSTTLDVVVTENVVQHITVESHIGTMMQGESVDQSKLIVTAYYLNGDVEIVPSYSYSLSSYAIYPGMKTQITVEYKGATATFEVAGIASENYTLSPSETIAPGGETSKPADTVAPGTGTLKPADTVAPGTGTSKPADMSSSGTGILKLADTGGTVNSNIAFSTSSKNVKYVDSVWVELTGSSGCFYQIVPSADKIKDSWKQFSGRITFSDETKDSMLYIKYLDNNGHEVMLQSEIFCIDNTKPKVNIKDGKKYTKNQKIIATDSISGVSKIKITGNANKAVKSGSVWKKEGKFSLTVTDKAGNINKVDFTLAKSPKKISVSYSVGKSWDELYFKSKVTGSNRSVKWSVSNKRIAEISKNGVLKAKKAGVCYVKCQLDQLTVKKKLKVSPDKYVIVY